MNFWLLDAGGFFTTGCGTDSLMDHIRQILYPPRGFSVSWYESEEAAFRAKRQKELGR